MRCCSCFYRTSPKSIEKRSFNAVASKEIRINGITIVPPGLAPETRLATVLVDVIVIIAAIPALPETSRLNSARYEIDSETAIREGVRRRIDTESCLECDGTCSRLDPIH